jgi:hypothetical protein
MITLRGDISRLNERMGKYAQALKLEPRAVVKMQAGILSRELAEGAAPRSKQALDRSIEKDVGKIYAPAPKQMIPMAHRQGKGFVWLMATPVAVVGVEDYDYHLSDTVEDMTRQFRKAPQLGKRYEDIGRRGVQKIVRLNRIVVKRPIYNKFLTELKKRAGILGGSWVIAWAVLQPKGRKPPAYKFRHVQDGTARGTYIDGLGIPGKATFTLINRATGCERPRQLEMLRGKLRHRLEAMTKDMKNQLRGAYKRAGFRNA